MPKPILNDKDHFNHITNILKETEEDILKLWEKLEEEE